MPVRVQKTLLYGAQEREWEMTRPSSVWSFRSQEKCTCGQINTAPENHASLTEYTQALSGTNTTRRIMTLTILHLKLSKVTNSTFFTQILLTNALLPSTSSSHAQIIKTLGFWGFMQDLHTKTLLSRLWTENGNILIDMASAVSSPMGSFNCGSTSKDTAIEDETSKFVHELLTLFVKTWTFVWYKVTLKMFLYSPVFFNLELTIYTETTNVNSNR